MWTMNSIFRPANTNNTSPALLMIGVNTTETTAALNDSVQLLSMGIVPDSVGLSPKLLPSFKDFDDDDKRLDAAYRRQVSRNISKSGVDDCWANLAVRRSSFAGRTAPCDLDVGVNNAAIYHVLVSMMFSHIPARLRPPLFLRPPLSKANLIGRRFFLYAYHEGGPEDFLCQKVQRSLLRLGWEQQLLFLGTRTFFLARNRPVFEILAAPSQVKAATSKALGVAPVYHQQGC